MEKLSDLEIRLLGALTEHSSRLTGDVAAKAGVTCGGNKRQASGATRSWLMSLKKRGLVDFHDNEKPTLWKRTEAGTRAYHGLSARLEPPSPSGPKPDAEFRCNAQVTSNK